MFILSVHSKFSQRNKEKNEIWTEYDRQFTICLHLWINENCKLETEWAILCIIDIHFAHVKSHVSRNLAYIVIEES